MKGNKQIAFLLLSLLLAAMAGCGNNAGGGATSTLAASESCIGCHANATSPGTGANIVTEWKASAHNTDAAANTTGSGSGCRNCHNPAAGHPNSCGGCHGGVTPGALPSQDVVTNPDQDQICLNCHGPGMDPTKDVMMKFAPQHFVNISTTTNVEYRASYVSSQNVGHCRNCHNPHDPSTNIAINKDAALLDGHSNPSGSCGVKKSADNFKIWGSPQPAAVNVSTSSICVRCHTTTGYINFVTSGFTDLHKWGIATDKTRQVLGCNACHDNGQGKAYSFKLRKVGPMVAYYNYSSPGVSAGVRLVNKPVNYPDVGPSNLCVVCHVGRGIGQMIKDAELQLAVMPNITSIPRFGTGHNFMAAAMIYKKAGYEYPTRVYDNPPTYAHDKIGMDNFNGTGTSGPCVTCHMKPNRHSYKAVLQTYSSGQLLQHEILPSSIARSTIRSIVSTACAHCHNDSFMPAWTPEKLQAQKAGYLAATEVLKELIKERGLIYYKPNTTTTVITRYWQRFAGNNRPNTMGAALNSYQFGVEPGAYVHNGVYTKRLIYDSIDWLNDGVLNDDVVTTINNIPFQDWSLATPAQEPTRNPITRLPYTPTEVTALKAAAISYLIGGSRP